MIFKKLILKWCLGNQLKMLEGMLSCPLSKTKKPVYQSRIIRSHQEEQKTQISLKVKTITLRTIFNLTLSITSHLFKNQTPAVFRMKAEKTLGLGAGQMKSMINLWRVWECSVKTGTKSRNSLPQGLVHRSDHMLRNTSASSLKKGKWISWKCLTISYQAKEKKRSIKKEEFMILNHWPRLRP